MFVNYKRRTVKEIEMARTRVRTTKIEKMTFIFMFQVESSNVAFLGHNGNKMYVQYKNDTMYEFDGIGLEQFHTILESESVGKAILATKLKGVKL